VSQKAGWYIGKKYVGGSPTSPANVADEPFPLPFELFPLQLLNTAATAKTTAITAEIRHA
jgi:hypothetical protein